MRFRSENEMQEHVCAALEERGWLTQREVPLFIGRADIVAWREDERGEATVLGVETKLKTAGVLLQAAKHLAWADEAWAVVPSSRQARALARWRDAGGDVLRAVRVFFCDRAQGLVEVGQAALLKSARRARKFRDDALRLARELRRWRLERHPACRARACLLNDNGRCALERPRVRADASSGVACLHALTEQQLRSLALLPVTAWDRRRLETLTEAARRGMIEAETLRWLLRRPLLAAPPARPPESYTRLREAVERALEDARDRRAAD